MKRLVLALALVFPLIWPSMAFAQGGSLGSVSSPLVNAQGQPIAGAFVSICQPLATTAASVTSNLAVLTMASNPITAGFAVGGVIQVAGFSGADTYFNGGTFTNGTGISGGYTILSVTSTTIMFALTHANAAATSNGTVLQMGNSVMTCGGLSTVYSDPANTSLITQPVTTDGLGNWQAFTAATGLYYVQFYGPAITTSFRQMTALAPSNLNNIIFVDGVKYMLSGIGIQAAVNAQTNGGTVYIPPGALPVASTINVPPNVKLVGMGMAPYDWGVSSGNPTSTTLLTWTGGSGGTVISFKTVPNVSNPTTNQGGGGIENLGIEGGGVAGIDIYVESVRHCTFRNLLLKDYTTSGLVLDTYANGTSGLTGSTDTQHNQFENIEFVLTSSVASAQNSLVLEQTQNSGTVGGNTSINTFINLRIFHKNGDAIRHLGDDNNRFYQITLQQNFGGTGVGIHFVGNSGSIQSYENTYYGVTGDAGGIVQETNANANAVYGYTRSNGGTKPVVNGSGYFFWSEQNNGGSPSFAEYIINNNFPVGQRELQIGTAGFTGTDAGNMTHTGSQTFEGQFGAPEFWKDTTPTFAGSVGMYCPGNSPGNNLVLCYYNGSSWSSSLFQITAGGPMAGAGTTVGSLPSAASNPGVFLYVTDSTAISSEGQTCAGSSSNKALAFSNGSVWKCF